MKLSIFREVQVEQSYRVARCQALFNVDRGDGDTFQIEAELPIDDLGFPEGDWTIGVVYGPSGSGKSSVAAELIARGWTEWGTESWGYDQAIIDDIGPDVDFDVVTGALASVGFGAVPSWLRPYRVLSNGERFRADLARLLVSDDDRVVVDEFTSVVDRRVAQIGSLAFAKAWRRQKTPRRVVLVTPHFDVLGWLKPDWVLRTSLTGTAVLGEDAVPEVVRPDGKVIAEIRA